VCRISVWRGVQSEQVGWEAGSAINVNGRDQPPPPAMKRNKETGEMEAFHSEALQDDLPSEEEEQAGVDLADMGCAADDY
jgi:hypothetical protein